MNPAADLKPGDILLYNAADIVDDIIDLKTGADVAHVEIYAGADQSMASRNGIGVGLYPFRPDGLRHVRRPVGVLDMDSARAFFAQVNGAKYGFGDILENANLDLPLPGYDCSHFAAALLRSANCPQFDGTYPELKITPRDFLISRESAAPQMNFSVLLVNARGGGKQSEAANNPSKSAIGIPGV